ncbi:uncharacterized protein PV06_08946 [Exophiala oligosperma]|uniref:Uncharacterized protein n=1 Tax=Exophiala oligosperma TaxID=215243 RepID=A0A0D2DU58_9EURO|nr:uncharacterized protein PV06_08946 [Exophiala oligosperma]KIW39144.1 hypothetical protein PV06_08946 [Exophiala oligosperma]
MTYCIRPLFSPGEHSRDSPKCPGRSNKHCIRGESPPPLIKRSNFNHSLLPPLPSMPRCCTAYHADWSMGTCTAGSVNGPAHLQSSAVRIAAVEWQISQRRVGNYNLSVFNKRWECWRDSPECFFLQKHDSTELRQTPAV